MLKPPLRRPRVRVRPIGTLSLNRMIPNILTLLALCAGMTAIRLGLSGKYEPACTAIIVAGILDGIDGRIARLLKGTSSFGAQLDSLARVSLWQAGLDFDHGTGHGVGSYLSVHEGPARISKLGYVALRRGMILSNEPGYYKTAAYGIRIENLVLVIAAPEPAGAEKPLNAFETLTLAPIDRRLVDMRMLTAKERHWLDSYHERVREEVAPLVDEQTRTWLAAATRPL